MEHGMQNNLKKAREALGLTQAETAKRAGIHINSYQLYESGKQLPNVLNAMMIAEALKISVYDVFILSERPDK